MKCLIIGGVAGGATTAARLRRMDEDAQIVIFERGPYISYANCGLPYYIGGVISERNALFLQTPTSFGNRFDADVRVSTEVTSIDKVQKKVTCVNLKTGKTYEESYDKLVLAPGTTAVKPPIPGIDAANIFTLRDVNDTDAIRTYLDSLPKPARVVVVGAGFIGMEMAENLVHSGCQVTLVEKASQILPPVDWEVAAEVQQEVTRNGVRLIVNDSVSAFVQNGNATQVQLLSGEVLEADMVLVSVGVKPLTTLAVNAGLEIGELGGIKVNEFMQTSDPDIYAVGDAVETVNPLTGQPQLCFLAGPANKQARICANNMVEGNIHRYSGSIGTGIAKVFGMTVGRTGLSERQLQMLNLPYKVSVTHTGDHATYYPGSHPVTIKLLFAPYTGQLLGASVCGAAGVDKRLDVLASTIAHCGTVYDLTDFDHAYAPPFSSPKDPVIVAGYVAENILAEKVKMIQWHELKEKLAHRQPDDFVLLDVRSLLENRAGTIEGAENYPLDELREYAEDMDPEQPVVVFCAIGLRGYIACRILMQMGFTNVVNLACGYKTWKACSGE